MNRADRRRMQKAEKKGTSEEYKAIMTNWNTAQTLEDRKIWMGAWMIDSFARIAAVEARSVRPIVSSIIEESKMFLNRYFNNQEDPYIEWHLSPTWFAEVLAQSIGTREKSTMKTLFHDIGLDFDSCVNPTYCQRSTIEEFTIHEILPGCDSTVKVSLITLGDCPVGSHWRSSTGKEWEVVETLSGRAEMMAVHNGFTIWRDELDVLKNFKRIPDRFTK